MKFSKFALLCALVLLVGNTRAQTLWKVTNRGQHRNLADYFTAISSYRDIVTVSAIEPTDTGFIPYRLVFYKSNDAGLTWLRQVPPIFADYEWGAFYVTKIEQIDSFTAIAKVDSTWKKLAGFLIRTTDGGVTWNRMVLPGNWLSLQDFDFSDAKTGIVLGGRSAHEDEILTTMDGGVSWSIHPSPLTTGSFLQACRSYGKNMFRAWPDFYTGMLTTRDDWSSFDSTNLPFPSSSDNLIHGFSWGNDDTMIGYGINAQNNGAIVRTTDAGMTWTNYPIADSLGDLNFLSPLNSDTLYSYGISQKCKLLRSIDGGASWQLDTIRLDSTYSQIGAVNITMTSSGHPVALFSLSGDPFDDGIIARGEPLTLSVGSRLQEDRPTIFPNPVSNRLIIKTTSSKQQVGMYDAVGREVIRGTSNEEGIYMTDVSGIPSGDYEVLVKLLNGKGIPCAVVVRH